MSTMFSESLILRRMITQHNRVTAAFELAGKMDNMSKFRIISNVEHSYSINWKDLRRNTQVTT